MKIILATQNKNKLNEFVQISKINYQNVSFVIKPLHDDIGDIEENGISYEQNSLIKAQTVFNYYQEPVLADDSGIELLGFKEILGINSSRFAGLNATSYENRNKLQNFLKERNIKENPARFVCVLTFKPNKDTHYHFKATWEGKVISDFKNVSEGFGYDPMFIPIGYNCTASELSISVKNKISHRGKALSNFFEFLNKHHWS